MQDVPQSAANTTAPGVHRTPTRAKRSAAPQAFPPLQAVADPAAPEAPAPSSGSILDQHPRASPIHITHETSITGAHADALWDAYRANFEPLASLAVLQHFYSRDEVLAELSNPRILKIVGWQDGQPVGLAMVTNSLEDVPQISPEFLRSSYPDHAATNTIYFGILVMVVPELRGRTLFSRLYIELWQVPATAGGVLVFDICDFNRLSFEADTLTQRIADNFPQSSVRVIDRQTWYVAELPRPIPSHPSLSVPASRSSIKR
ncbi:unannotated protein [freshwater metagenome]|uniref:Unannotated protein n=1 Tax=freshwater metagenome TaxID=449393 RepID=A0A6J7EZ23_9ZZZZ|nr:hypothetical protein [Actinomycetota bacterium]